MCTLWMFGCVGCLLVLLLAAGDSPVSGYGVDRELAALKRALETAETARGYGGDDDEPPCDLDDPECLEFIQNMLGDGNGDGNGDRKRSQQAEKRYGVDRELAALKRALETVETARGYGGDDDEPPCDLDDPECLEFIQNMLGDGNGDDDGDRKRSQQAEKRSWWGSRYGWGHYYPGYGHHAGYGRR